MYQTLMDFLNFVGLNGSYPSTVGEFVSWFVLVMTCICVIRFVLNSFFAVVNWVRKGDR